MIPSCTFSSNQLEKWILALSFGCLSLCTSIMLCGQNVISFGGVNVDSGQTPVSCAIWSLTMLECQIFLQLVYTAWILPVVTYLTGDSPFFWQALMIYAALWEPVLLGIRKWTFKCTFYRFSLLKRILLTFCSVIYLTASVTNLDIKKICADRTFTCYYNQSHHIHELHERVTVIWGSCKVIRYRTYCMLSAQCCYVSLFRYQYAKYMNME